ncbi:MAG: ABC transporter ATP-binding protein [Archaeoglobaceae archaeon]|nr:ABC transporter ATP-binding protein [Archaeoglobaceae archaeon]MDW7989116.1 ABC transporter ATP-binding protein [Archaeoglobaceae archaeon]
MLKVENLYASYGREDILRDVNLEVLEKETVAILGPNGAGKTTLLKAICGLLKTRGRILFEGKDISGLKTHKRIALGIAISPEGRRIFPNMNVRDNLLITGFKNLEEVYEIFPRLKERRDQLAGTLSGGEQQMLSIARALMFKPKLLLLDEPSFGLAPVIVETLSETIHKVKDLGVSILLVEQNLSLVAEISDRIYVLSGGEIVDEGTRRDIERIEKSYFT